MKSWKILYYESENGECKLSDYLDSLSERQKAKVFSWIEMLEEYGPVLPRPYADFLEDDIHELRVKVSSKQVRVLYFFCYKDYIVLTHHFIKTTDKVPKSEIKKAKLYQANFLKRHTLKKLNKEFNNENI